jgi:hypothetical protein
MFEKEEPAKHMRKRRTPSKSETTIKEKKSHPNLPGQEMTSSSLGSSWMPDLSPLTVSREEEGYEPPMSEERDDERNSPHDDASFSQKKMASNEVFLSLSWSLMNQVKYLARSEGVSPEDLITDFIGEGINKRLQEVSKSTPSHLMTRTGYVGSDDTNGYYPQPHLSHHQKPNYNSHSKPTNHQNFQKRKNTNNQKSPSNRGFQKNYNNNGNHHPKYNNQNKNQKPSYQNNNNTHSKNASDQQPFETDILTTESLRARS